MEKESFILHNSFYEPIKALKNEQLGKLLRAIFNYTINGEITQDNEIFVAFMFIKKQIDIDSDKWEETRKQRSIAGKKGMESRWGNKDNEIITNDNRVITKITNDNSVISDITKITDNVNVNVNDNVINKKENIKRKKDTIKKEKYGVYGRVKLTIDEYLKLVNEFGEDFIKKQIDLLDEYIEGNNNKNRYTNFNLVLRKSIRENWFKQKKEGKSNNVFLDIMKDDYGR